MLEKYRSPFEAFVFPEFKRKFGDLFSVRAEVGDYEYNMVVNIMSNLILLHLERDDRLHLERTVRAAHHYLDHGALKRPREVCESYLRVVNEIPGTLNRVMEKKSNADLMVDSDRRIEAFLDYYKSLYEGLMTLVVAPVVVGFALYCSSKSKEFRQKPNGRVNLRAIESMEKWIHYPSNRLKEGLNRHVRNAYAHERFRLLDGERFEMWDEDHHGKRTWGPEVWPLASLEALSHRLYVTSLGVTLALMLFGINYRKLITDRGWILKDAQAPKLRLEEARRLFGLMAEYNGFDITRFEQDERVLRLTLVTQHRGIDQEVEILLGGEGWSRGYKKPVKYVQAFVIVQVFGVLQRVAHNIDDVDTFSVAVKNEESVDIGELVISRAALNNLQGPRNTKISEDRKQAEVDTLGESKMWVKTEGATRPY